MANDTLLETPVASGTEVKPTDETVLNVFGKDILMKNGRPKNVTDGDILMLTGRILRAGDIGKIIGSHLGHGRKNVKRQVLCAYMTDASEEALKSLVVSWDLEYHKRYNGKVSEDHNKRMTRMYELIAAKTPAEFAKVFTVLAGFGGTLAVLAEDGKVLITLADLLGRFVTGNGFTNNQLAKFSVVDHD